MKLLASLLAVALLLPLGRTDAAAQSPISYREATLPTGKLFVPSDWKPRGDQADLLVFFHGHPPLVCSNLTRSGKSSLLIVVNFNGLSAAYAKPFTDTNLFGKILSDARRELSRQFGRELAQGKLAVASFSAGYGAVREILKQPTWRERITDLVLADSLYAGYVERDGANVLNPDHVQDFIHFAQRAARREVTMVVTHSAQVPEGYASTTETVEELLRAVGGSRVRSPDSEIIGMTQSSHAIVGRFQVLGYRGDTAQDHMNHLRNVWLALKETSLPARQFP
jgi:hypothetical protein